MTFVFQLLNIVKKAKTSDVSGRKKIINKFTILPWDTDIRHLKIVYVPYYTLRKLQKLFH